jgi:hypothetical protein
VRLWLVSAIANGVVRVSDNTRTKLEASLFELVLSFEEDQDCPV